MPQMPQPHRVSLRSPSPNPPKTPETEPARETRDAAPTRPADNHRALGGHETIETAAIRRSETARQSAEIKAALDGDTTRRVHHKPDQVDFSRESPRIPSQDPTPDQPSSVENAVRDIRNDLLEQSAWRAARHLADVVHPGAGMLVAGSYIAIKALGGLSSLNRGDAFYVMIPATIAGTELTFCIGVRQLSPNFGVRFTADLMEYSYVEHAAGREPMPARRGDWPGEWTLQYGLDGIRDHGAVLGRRPKVLPNNGRTARFTEPPKPNNSAVWDIQPEQHAYRITLPGRAPEDFSYEVDNDSTG